MLRGVDMHPAADHPAGGSGVLQAVATGRQVLPAAVRLYEQCLRHRAAAATHIAACLRHRAAAVMLMHVRRHHRAAAATLQAAQAAATGLQAAQAAATGLQAAQAAAGSGKI